MGAQRGQQSSLRLTSYKKGNRTVSVHQRRDIVQAVVKIRDPCRMGRLRGAESASFPGTCQREQSAHLHLCPQEPAGCERELPRASADRALHGTKHRLALAFRTAPGLSPRSQPQESSAGWRAKSWHSRTQLWLWAPWPRFPDSRYTPDRPRLRFHCQHFGLLSLLLSLLHRKALSVRSWSKLPERGCHTHKPPASACSH